MPRPIRDSYSSLMAEEKAAIKEFGVSIEDFIKLSFDEKNVVLKRFRQNERLRLSEKYGLQHLTHNSGPVTLVTRKATKDRCWVTYFYRTFYRGFTNQVGPLKLWGYSRNETDAIEAHKTCLAWLDEKVQSLL